MYTWRVRNEKNTLRNQGLSFKFQKIAASSQRKLSPGKERRQTGELELTETRRPRGSAPYARRQSQKQLPLSCPACERCAGPGRGSWGHFPSSMDRLLTFWLAAGLTPPVHHWALSIPQDPQTAHKFWGPGMNSASQHPLKGLHRSAIKKNSSTSLTLISSLAKSHRSKWLGTLRRGGDAECWQPSLNIFFWFILSCSAADGHKLDRMRWFQSFLSAAASPQRYI